MADRYDFTANVTTSGSGSGSTAAISVTQSNVSLGSTATANVIGGGLGPKGDPATNLVQSVNGKQGVVVLNASDVNADPTGSASQALSDAKGYTDTEVSTLDSTLATVAKTGSYNDLSNKPTIPSIAGLATEAQVQNVQDNLDSHEADTANPHSVTKAQVGLGNVENLAPADMPVSTATQTALNGKVDKTGDSLIIGASAPTPAVGEKVLWLNTTGGNITLNLVTGD